jgi:hypothetical protein
MIILITKENEMDEYWTGYDLGYNEGYAAEPSVSAIMKGAAARGEADGRMEGFHNDYSQGHLAGFVEGFMARPGVDWYKFLKDYNNGYGIGRLLAGVPERV